MFFAVSGTILTFSFSRTLGAGLKQNLDNEIKKSRGVIFTLIGLVVGAIISWTTIAGIFSIVDLETITLNAKGFDAKRYGILLVEKYPIALELIGTLILLCVIGSMFLLRKSEAEDAS